MKKAQFKNDKSITEKEFKTIQKDLIDIFNELVEVKELTKEHYSIIKSYQDDLGYLPIPHTINDLKTMRLLFELKQRFDGNIPEGFDMDSLDRCLSKPYFKLYY